MSFSKQIVSRDEKWLFYVNLQKRPQCLYKNKTPQPSPKADLQPRKMILRLWWTFKVKIHFELLLTITRQVSYQQFERLQ